MRHPPTGVGGISLWCLPRWYQRKSHFQLHPVKWLFVGASCAPHEPAAIVITLRADVRIPIKVATCEIILCLR
jgi:hypothetical protein